MSSSYHVVWALPSLFKKHINQTLVGVATRDATLVVCGITVLQCEM